MVGLIAVVVLVAGVLAVIVSGAAARDRAQHAADLAALAAADRIVVPVGVVLDPAAVQAADPCGTARGVADRNGAELVACDVGAGGTVHVAVTVPGGVGRGSGLDAGLGSGGAGAEAVAGPSWVRGDRPAGAP